MSRSLPSSHRLLRLSSFVAWMGGGSFGMRGMGCGV
jgi:hypothetical protein